MPRVYIDELGETIRFPDGISPEEMQRVIEAHIAKRKLTAPEALWGLGLRSPTQRFLHQLNVASLPLSAEEIENYGQRLEQAAAEQAAQEEKQKLIFSLAPFHRLGVAAGLGDIVEAFRKPTEFVSPQALAAASEVASRTVASQPEEVPSDLLRKYGLHDAIPKSVWDRIREAVTESVDPVDVAIAGAGLALSPFAPALGMPLVGLTGAKKVAENIAKVVPGAIGKRVARDLAETAGKLGLLSAEQLGVGAVAGLGSEFGGVLGGLAGGLLPPAAIAALKPVVRGVGGKRALKKVAQEVEPEVAQPSTLEPIAQEMPPGSLTTSELEFTPAASRASARGEILNVPTPVSTDIGAIPPYPKTEELPLEAQRIIKSTPPHMRSAEEVALLRSLGVPNERYEPDIPRKFWNPEEFFAKGESGRVNLFDLMAEIRAQVKAASDLVVEARPRGEEEIKAVISKPPKVRTPKERAEVAAELIDPALDDVPGEVVKTITTESLPDKLPDLPGKWVVGKQTTLLVPQGSIPAQYAIAASDDLIPSHLSRAGFLVNPDYPFTNERPYHISKSLQSTTLYRANTLDPRYLVNVTPTPVDGPPVVDRNGVVYGGNGRVMAVHIAPAERLEMLRQAVVENAEEFGIPRPVAEEWVRNNPTKVPVIVRVIEPRPGEESRLIRLFNQTAAAGFTESQLGAAAAKLLSGNTKSLLLSAATNYPNLSQALSSPLGVEILRGLVADGVIPPAQAGGMVGPGGKLTYSARELIRKTILGCVVDDPDYLLQLEQVAPGIVNKVEAAAPHIVGLPEAYQFKDIMGRSLEVVRLSKIYKMPVWALELQMDLFGGSREMDVLVKSLAEKLLTLGPRQLGTIMEQYRNNAELFSQPTLSFIKRESREELLSRLFVGNPASNPDVVQETVELGIRFGMPRFEVDPPKVVLKPVEQVEAPLVITSNSDLMSLARRSLGVEADEHLLAVVLDDQNHVLGVIRHSIGGPDATTVSAAHLIGSMNVPGASQFYLIHNHPSGKPMPSEADMKVATLIHELTSGTPLQFRGFAIYARGANGGVVLNPADGFVARSVAAGQPVTEGSVPLYVRRYTEEGTPILPEEIETFHKRVAPGMGGVVLLDNKGVPLRFVPLSGSVARRLRPKASTELLESIHSSNATKAVVLAGGDWTEQSISNIARFFDKLGKSVSYEILDADNYVPILPNSVGKTFYANPIFNPLVIRSFVRQAKEFWEDNVGEALWRTVSRNAGTTLVSGTSAAIAANLTEDSDLTPEQRIGLIVLSAVAAAGGAKGALKIGIGDKFGSWFIPNYKLPAKYVELKHDMVVLREQIAREFVQAGKALANEVKDVDALSALGKIWIGDYPSNEEAEALLRVPRHVVKKWTRELVDLGLLSERTWLKNIDTYVKRSYLIHEPLRVAPDRPLVKLVSTIASEFMMRGTVKVVPKSEVDEYLRRGWEIVGSAGRNKVKVRMDYSPEMREAMGEITNAVYNLLRTGEIISNDVATYKFYQWIAENFASDVQQPGYVQVRAGVKAGTNVPKYGALEGKWIPREIYNDLQNMAIARAVKQLPGVRHYLALNAGWKAAKTVYNPVVHMNNTIANLHLYYMRDGNFLRLGDAAKELYKEWKNPGSSLLANTGLLNDYVTQELRGLKENEVKRLVSALREVSFRNHVAKAIAVANAIADAGPKLYHLEDVIFRAGMYLTKLDEGWTPSAAAMYAKKSFVDYDINAPAINFLRALPLPFIGWTVGAIPVLVETALRRPWKYAALAAFWWGINELGSKGEKESTLKYEETMMPERYGGHIFGLPFMPPRAIRLPGVTINDKPVRLELTRWWPGADVVEAGYGKTAVAGLPQPLQPTWGALGSIINVLQGIDTFTGRKVPGWGASPYQHMADLAAREFLPPLVPGGFHFNRIMRAARGVERTSAYAEPYTVLQAALAAAGIRLHQMDTAALTGMKVGELRRELRDLDEEMLETKRLAKSGMMTLSEAAEALQKLELQRRELVVKFIKKIQPALEAEKKEKKGRGG